MFAKLFEVNNRQVLVKIDQEQENFTPEVRVYAEPHGAGVCSIAHGYDDNKEGWTKAQKFFDEFNQEHAEKHLDMLDKAASNGGIPEGD